MVLAQSAGGVKSLRVEDPATESIFHLYQIASINRGTKGFHIFREIDGVVKQRVTLMEDAKDPLERACYAGIVPSDSAWSVTTLRCLFFNLPEIENA